DILDRNGRILATDIKTPSLYADPRQIIDADEAVDQLTQLFPGLDGNPLRADFKSDRAFIFVRREMTPAQQAKVHALGIPGLGFVEESRRVYPAGPTASHILGHVNIDNVGLAGFERYIDSHGLAALRQAGLAADQQQRPVSLSIDLRAQYALRAELIAAQEKYRAKAASGIVLDAHSGEIVALASLPDYDPNDAASALQPDRLNRVTGGVFEMGSTLKVFTTAMALDEGVATLKDSYDASKPIRVASFTIEDYHGKNRWLSVPEIFIYSSNIGAARMALDVGVERHQEFLRRLGLLDRLESELPETATPLVPAKWREITTMTAAFGHGISVTPLQVASGVAALVNGGYLVPPTLLPRSRAEAQAVSKPVVKDRTSQAMRYLMRLNVQTGTATQADVEGFRLGGKTGTAEKIVNGRYARNKLLTSFVGIFPSEDPQYVVLVMLDEPHGTAEPMGYATAGWNAAPTAGRIVERIAPMLGVAPRFERPEGGVARAIQVSY
ncbi:MAG TPA: penicillin-binding protein 2, partial [Hyphomicrobiales bacterium]|nr:penicillin-binding protein 2 [Hyphomicrobiales bacterium]